MAMETKVQNRMKLRPGTGPEYVFSVEDYTRPSNGVVTLRVGGVHLPNVLIDSGATSNLLGKPT